MSPRQVVNGAQETIDLLSAPDEFDTPHWFADTYLAARSLSTGDRSAIMEALRLADSGETASLMTGSGSVTQELYDRLTAFGYLTEEATGIDLAAVKRFRINPDTDRRLALLLMAANVDMLTDPVMRQLSAKLPGVRGIFNDVPVDITRRMADGFHQTETPLAEAGEPLDLFTARDTLGVAEEREGFWHVTQLGTLTMPYFLDHLVFLNPETHGGGPHEH